MRRMQGWAVMAGIVMGWGAPAAFADTVILDDGSRLNGTVKSMSADTLELDTSFAGTMSLAREQIRGIDTDAAVPVALDSGERVQGVLVYDAEQDAQGHKKNDKNGE